MRRRDFVVAFGVAVAVMAALALRAPMAARQFWAEDGTVFFQAPVDKGPVQPIVDAYAGYFHFVPA